MPYGEGGLVLARRRGESVVIGEGEDAVIVTIVSPGLNGGKVTLGFDAPDDVLIERRDGEAERVFTLAELTVAVEFARRFRGWKVGRLIETLDAARGAAA